VNAPHASLQFTEAVARRGLLDLTSYDVDLDLSGDGSTFRSVTTIELVSGSGATFLDLKPVAVASVRLDGRPLDLDLLDRGRFPLELGEGPHRIEVDATMPFRRDGEGLHRRSTRPTTGSTSTG